MIFGPNFVSLKGFEGLVYSKTSMTSFFGSATAIIPGSFLALT